MGVLVVSNYSSRGCAPLSRLANYYPKRFHAFVFISVSYIEPGLVQDIGMQSFSPLHLASSSLEWKTHIEVKVRC